MARFSVFLIMVAIIAGLVGCTPTPTQYDLTISSTEGGTVTSPGEPGPYVYDKGSVVNLTAEAEEGYRFAEWTGDVDTIADINAASTTIIMNAAYVITANFEELNAEKLFAGGNGTEEDPYRLVDWHNLNNIRYFLSAHYRLMNDLDSNTTGYAGLASPSANDGMGWEPIGDFQKLGLAFTGALDGQGHEIRDLCIDRPDEDNVGLFDVILSGAVVENVGIVKGSVTGGSNVGSIAGGSTGTVNCSHFAGSVTGKMSVGGLVGNKGGTVSNSYVTGNVSGNVYVGGLVAMNSAGNVGNCYVAGNVSGNVCAGGLVGLKAGGTVSNSFWDREASGIEESDGGTGKGTAEMMSIATFSGAGWNIAAVANLGTRNTSYIWNIVDGQTYPFLSRQAALSDTLQVQNVTSQEAFDLIQENHGNPGFVILDVRTSSEFHDGHIEGALNIDVSLPSFGEELEQLDKNDTYLVYCRSGNRSRIALGIMEELGFTLIYHLANGFAEWVDAGLPVSQ